MFLDTVNIIQFVDKKFQAYLNILHFAFIYIWNLAVKIIKLQILSVVVRSLCPNNIKHSLKEKLCVWVHLRFNKSDNSFQNVWTFLHCHKRCCMVSLWAPQKVHSSLCSLLNFDTDRFVDSMWWSTLYWNQRNFVSNVSDFREAKLLFQFSAEIPRSVDHLLWPVTTVSYRSFSDNTAMPLY